jgi:DNA-binding transcriptional ArsR family regulator
MSEHVKNLEEELEHLKKRMERLETSLSQSRNEEAEVSRVDSLFEWQQRIPPIKDYDIWSVILAKRQGIDNLHIGYQSGGADYAKIVDLSPEDAANLAGAVSHPARILILRECQKAAQYPSDLEKTVSAKYGALYHHINSLVEAKLLEQEKERGKYIATSAGKTALLFLNVLASVIASVEAQIRQSQAQTET